MPVLLPSDIRAVLFDAVGTLIHPDPGAVAVYADAARRRGVDLSPDLIRSRFWAAYQAEEATDRAAGWVTSEDREHARWRRIVADALPEVADGDALFRELFDHFGRPEAWRVDADAAAVFAALRARGIVIGVGSNYDARLLRVAAGRPELATPGMPIVVSAAVGWRKPAPQFFETAARAVGRPPGDILFVGDDLGNDYHGATAAGLRAVLVDPRGRHPEGSRHISRLAELL